MNVKLIATAAMGIEAIVAREVKNLGYECQVENGKVIFEAPITAIPRCNLWLRTADRVKLIVGTFKARTFDELFEKTKDLSWEKYIPEDGKVPVIGRSHRSKLYSVPDCQAIVKKAIVDRLSLKHGLASSLPETGALYRVEVALLNDIATLTIDTSGAGLHKRGYRINQGKAPLKETLAATLVMLTNWQPEEPLIDPFCGSGTIPIEAALIGQNIAPGFNRSFVSEDWSFINESYWTQAYEEIDDLANYDQKLKIIGSDISHKSIKMSINNSAEAGLHDLIEFKQMQLKDLSIKETNGYLIGNPPYGERLSEREEVERFYQQLGRIMKDHPSWSVYILTANKHFEFLYGKEATRRRKLFNGFIETTYYQYFGKKIK